MFLKRDSGRTAGSHDCAAGSTLFLALPLSSQNTPHLRSSDHHRQVVTSCLCHPVHLHCVRDMTWFVRTAGVALKCIFTPQLRVFYEVYLIPVVFRRWLSSHLQVIVCVSSLHAVPNTAARYRVRPVAFRLEELRGQRVITVPAVSALTKGVYLC